jgi:hypothetical protein
MKMKGVGSFKTLVLLYKTARCQIPEDCNLYAQNEARACIIPAVSRVSL